MTVPESLSAEKRGKILSGAALVFAEAGYEGASMQRIALVAGVSKGTLYNHFGSKAALFREHLLGHCRGIVGRFLEPPPPDTPLADTLFVVARRMVLIGVRPNRRNVYRMVIAEAESFPELARAFFASGPDFAVRSMSEWIATEVARGRLAADDPAFAAEQFFALCQARLWIRYRLHLQDEPDNAEIDLVAQGAVSTFLARYGVPLR